MNTAFECKAPTWEPEATARFAETLAPYLRTGDVLLLSGPLGAGKSHFARALIRAILGNPDEEVPSPTFTLVQIYEQEKGPAIWHFDLYRLQEADDIFELGIEEAFETGMSLIEWPERMVGHLPENCLHITITVGEKERERHIEFRGSADWKQRLDRWETGAE